MRTCFLDFKKVLPKALTFCQKHTILFSLMSWLFVKRHENRTNWHVFILLLFQCKSNVVDPGPAQKSSHVNWDQRIVKKQTCWIVCLTVISVQVQYCWPQTSREESSHVNWDQRIVKKQTCWIICLTVISVQVQCCWLRTSREESSHVNWESKTCKEADMLNYLFDLFQCKANVVDSWPAEKRVHM